MINPLLYKYGFGFRAVLVSAKSAVFMAIQHQNFNFIPLMLMRFQCIFLTLMNFYYLYSPKWTFFGPIFPMG